MLFERKALGDVLTETPELRIAGDWLCLNIETGTAWPTKAQSFTFEGREIWLMPLTTDNYPGLAINRPAGLGKDDAWALLHRALSYIAWSENTGAMVSYMSGGGLPRMMGLGGKTGGVTLRDEFDFTDVREPKEKRAQLALALMREGRGINHPAYAFLSFFRVVEIAVPDGKARGVWVAANIDKLTDHQAKEALDNLRQTGVKDVGKHLFDSGRCAIAHAKADPIINPDDPRDARRLQAELPIIRALAIQAIESELGVQTSHTIWREHLYELAGWKRIFGEKIVAAVLGGIPPDAGEVDAPHINVRLRRSPPFAPFERMNPVQAAYGDQRIEVVYRSSDSLVDLVFWLNFAEERLVFDPQRSVVGRDDKSVGAAFNGKELDRFFRDYFCNGELQMWDADTDELISRCDAFIPVNVMVNIDACNAAIDRWDAVIAEREAAAAAE